MFWEMGARFKHHVSYTAQNLRPLAISTPSLISSITFDRPTSSTKPTRFSDVTPLNTDQSHNDILMACSNASQYIQQLSTKPLPPLLSTSPKFSPAVLIVHAIIQSNLVDIKSMPPNTFATFLQTSLRECAKSDQDTVLHETYIFFLFTQILREIISHLAIHDNSPFHTLLNDLQTQLILTLTQPAGTVHINFGFHRTLPSAGNWAPINSPARTRTWVVWPDIPDCTAKQYSDQGWTHMADIPQDFQVNHYRANQEEKAPPDHPLWLTEYAKNQGRPLRRRTNIRSFPFTPTDHPFSTAQADLLFSLLTTLDGLTFPDEWDAAFSHNPRGQLGDRKTMLHKGCCKTRHQALSTSGVTWRARAAYHSGTTQHHHVASFPLPLL